MSDINIDANDMMIGIYFAPVTDVDHIRIMCNWCTEKGSMFYDGKKLGCTTQRTWLSNAATHLVTKHADKIGAAAWRTT